MSLLSSRFAQLTIEHVISLLREDLPVELQARTLIGEHFPGLLSQLPFISVAARIKGARNTGLGGTVGIKRVVVDSALVDLGYITGESGACEFTLTLWAITRPQLEEVRVALEAIDWVRQVRESEAPEGILNRTTFLRCRLEDASATLVAPLPPAPPSIQINADNTDLLAAPDAAADVLGQANAGHLFELVGRSEGSDFVQGCCFQGSPIWVAMAAVTIPVPVTTLPVIPSPAPRSTRRRTRAAARHAEIDAGTAIVAAATTPVTTAWRQDLQYGAYLEATQEPTVTEGALIQELRITRQLGAGDQILDTERTRLRQDSEEVVDDF